MITSIFEKTRPLNYLIIGILLFVFFLLYFLGHNLFENLVPSLGYFILYFGLTLTSAGLLNFIILKNNLTKNNNFAELFFLFFLLFFSEIFKSGSILIANFFALLSLRRLLSLKSMKNTKEKLFDASFWIFIAALFHFWAISFIVLVFISIVLDFSRDYKNWLIPFIAFFVVGILLTAFNLMFDNQIWIYLKEQAAISFNFFYFNSVWQNIAFATFAAIALLFTFNMGITVTAKPLNLQSSYKKVMAWFVVAIVVFCVSSNKSNALLLFCLPPLSIMGANYIQGVQINMVREVMVLLIFALSLVFFFTAL